MRSYTKAIVIAVAGLLLVVGVVIDVRSTLAAFSWHGSALARSRSALSAC